MLTQSGRRLLSIRCRRAYGSYLRHLVLSAKKLRGCRTRWCVPSLLAIACSSRPSALTEPCAGVDRSIQAHLERSNAELAAEDAEDPDFKEAIAENEVILVAQQYKIQQCELRLQQLGGDSAPHDDGDDVEVARGTDILAIEGGSDARQVDSPAIVPEEVEPEPGPEPEPEPAADDGLYL